RQVRRGPGGVASEGTRLASQGQRTGEVRAFVRVVIAGTTEVTRLGPDGLAARRLGLRPRLDQVTKARLAVGVRLGRRERVLVARRRQELAYSCQECSAEAKELARLWAGEGVRLLDGGAAQPVLERHAWAALRRDGDFLLRFFTKLIQL